MWRSMLAGPVVLVTFGACADPAFDIANRNCNRVQAVVRGERIDDPAR